MNQKNILIVDDSYDHQLLLKTILESKGIQTHCTPNGEEALTLLKSMPKLPDAILLDLRMPVMDGLTFRRLQKADPQLANIPVVVMSGEEDTETIRNQTKTVVLRKPLNMDSLVHTLEKNAQIHISSSPNVAFSSQN